MEPKDILLVLSPFIASYLTYFFGFRTKRKEEIIKFKEERYLQLLGEIKHALVVDKITSNEKQHEHMNLFLDKQRELWLYGGDEVIKALKNLLELFINNPEGKIPKEFEKLLGNVVISMRQDLGIKSSLKNTDFTLIHSLEK